MTRHACMALSLTLALLVAAVGVAETVRTVAERVEVRREANPSAGIHGSVPKGTVFEVLGRERGWIRVAYPIGNGAFYAGFVPEVFCEDARGAAPSTLEPTPPEPPSSDHPASASTPGAIPPGPVVPQQQTAAAPPAQPALPEQVASTANVPAVATAPAATQPSTAKRKVLILQIADGKSRDGDTGAGSGAALAAAIRDALVARGILPFVSEYRSMEEGIKEAKGLSYESILRVTITEWEDNATAWSGNPDSAAISIELFDLTPTLISSATQRKKGSRWAMSSKSPDQWFPELVKATVTRVFGPS
jgi:hypothetical protein